MFGGFSSAFYDAYEKEYPFDPGFRIRKTLYNLYHELNHYNLFGGGYASSAQSSIDQLLQSLWTHPSNRSNFYRLKELPSVYRPLPSKLIGSTKEKKFF